MGGEVHGRAVHRSTIMSRDLDGALLITVSGSRSVSAMWRCGDKQRDAHELINRYVASPNIAQSHAVGARPARSTSAGSIMMEVWW